VTARPAADYQHQGRRDQIQSKSVHCSAQRILCEPHVFAPAEADSPVSGNALTIEKDFPAVIRDIA